MNTGVFMNNWDFLGQLVWKLYAYEPNSQIQFVFLAIVTLRISLSSADINECAPDPCQNGGNCFDQINNYTCKCLLGYTGKNCEVGECKRNGWIETYIETLPLLEGTSWSGFIANLQALKPGQLGPSSSIHLEVIYARSWCRSCMHMNPTLKFSLVFGHSYSKDVHFFRRHQWVRTGSMPKWRQLSWPNQRLHLPVSVGIHGKELRSWWVQEKWMDRQKRNKAQQANNGSLGILSTLSTLSKFSTFSNVKVGLPRWFSWRKLSIFGI